MPIHIDIVQKYISCRARVIAQASLLQVAEFQTRLYFLTKKCHHYMPKHVQSLLHKESLCIACMHAFCLNIYLD